MGDFRKLKDVRAGDRFYFSFIGFREGEEMICERHDSGTRLENLKSIDTNYITVLEGDKRKYFWGDDVDKDVEVVGSIIKDEQTQETKRP